MSFVRPRLKQRQDKYRPYAQLWAASSCSKIASCCLQEQLSPEVGTQVTPKATQAVLLSFVKCFIPSNPLITDV